MMKPPQEKARKPEPFVVTQPPGGVLELADTLHPVLRGELERGRVIVWGARFSGNGNESARKTCVLDALQGAEDLARAGIEVRHLLPSEEEMKSYLRSAQGHASVDAKTKRRFHNRFVELWLTPQLLLLLSTGTGSRVDEQNLAQPFLTHLHDVVKRTTPALLFAKRFDRLGRRAWGLGASLDILKFSAPAFVGDQNGILPLDEMAEMRVFIEAARAEGFAATIPRQTRRGMLSRSGTEMVDGMVDYGCAAPPPPGFARLTLLGSGLGANGQKVMCLEQPGCLPPRERVALGYPEVIDPDTQQVRDQVANVRWALEKLADPAWSMEAIGQGLIARQYSNTKIREVRGPSGIAAPQVKQVGKERYGYPAQNVPGAIIRNLDVYETGTLVRTLGVEGVQDVVITNVFPVDGRPWADPETFSKIRDRLAGKRKAFASRGGLVLAGLRATVNGSPAVLRTVSKDRKVAVPRHEHRYSVVDAQFQNSARLNVHLPHEGIARVIAEGLDHAVEMELPLPTLALPDQLRGTIERAQHQAMNARAQCRDAETHADLLYRRVNDPAVAGALLMRLQDEYNTLSQITIPNLEAEIERKENDITRMMSEAEQSRGYPADRLAVLVEALGDPQRLDHKEAIHRLISDLRIDMERVDYGHLKGWIAHVTVQLALTDEDGTTYCLEHSGDVPIAGPETRGKKARSFVEQALNGTGTKTQCKGVHPREMADELGLHGRQAHITGILDGRLFKIALATAKAHNQGVDDDVACSSIARELDEPEILVRRLQGMYAPEAVGRDSRWWKERLTWRPRAAIPCTHCGHPAVRAPLIAEIRIGVCPDCRLDADAVYWGPEYDQYLVVQTADGPRTLTGIMPKWRRPAGREFDPWPE